MADTIVDFSKITVQGVADSKAQASADKTKQKIQDDLDKKRLKDSMSGKTEKADAAQKSKLAQVVLQKMQESNPNDPSNLRDQAIEHLQKLYASPAGAGKPQLRITDKTTLQEIQHEIEELENMTLTPAMMFASGIFALTKAMEQMACNMDERSAPNAPKLRLENFSKVVASQDKELERIVDLLCIRYNYKISVGPLGQLALLLANSAYTVHKLNTAGVSVDAYVASKHAPEPLSPEQSQAMADRVAAKFGKQPSKANLGDMASQVPPPSK